jgi:hypothetical protein
MFAMFGDFKSANTWQTNKYLEKVLVAREGFEPPTKGL